jgi:hypothetical protein
MRPVSSLVGIASYALTGAGLDDFDEDERDDDSREDVDGDDDESFGEVCTEDVSTSSTSSTWSISSWSADGRPVADRALPAPELPEVSDGCGLETAFSG